MIFAHGSRFGGHALIVKDGQLSYIYNFLGVPPEKMISASVPTSGRHIVGVDFTGGRVVKVVFDVADDAYIDVERHFAAAMARD